MPSFDDIVNELQDKINEETLEAYGQTGFERWRNPPHRGKPAKANYEGASTGKCGDTIRIFLHIEDDRVRDAGFATDGCGSSMISGSMAAELAVDKPCEALAAISGETVLEGLGGPDCLPVDTTAPGWRPTPCTRPWGITTNRPQAVRRKAEDQEFGTLVRHLRVAVHPQEYSPGRTGKGVVMSNPVKIGIVICDRYRTCAGGKCLRSMRERAGAFSIYADKEIELVGYATCNGCPGGNVEYLGDEMAKNGVDVIHLATGLIVGYPPCPYIGTFKLFLESRYGVEVVVGTHPIPEKYLDMHTKLGTWEDPEWQPVLEAAMSDEPIRKAYD